MINRFQSYDINSAKANQSNYLYSQFDSNSNFTPNNLLASQSMKDSPECMTNEMYKKRIEMMASEIKPQPAKEIGDPHKKSQDLNKKKRAISPVLIQIRNELTPHYSDINSTFNEDINSPLNIINYKYKSQHLLSSRESNINDTSNHSISTVSNSNSNYSNNQNFTPSNNVYLLSNTNEIKKTNFQIPFFTQNINPLQIQNNVILNNQNFLQNQPFGQNNSVNQDLGFCTNVINFNVNCQAKDRNFYQTYLDYKTFQKMNLINQMSFIKNQNKINHIAKNHAISPLGMSNNPIISYSYSNTINGNQNLQNLYLNQNFNYQNNFSKNNFGSANNFIQVPENSINKNIIQGISGIQNQRFPQINYQNNNPNEHKANLGFANYPIQITQNYIPRLINQNHFNKENAFILNYNTSNVNNYFQNNRPISNLNNANQIDFQTNPNFSEYSQHITINQSNLM